MVGLVGGFGLKLFLENGIESTGTEGVSTVKHAENACKRRRWFICVVV
jgi:hypothetical protein